MSYELQFLTALTTTIAIEIPVALLMVQNVFNEKKISGLRTVGIGILATALTIPYLRFIFAAFFDYRTMAIVGECFVVIVEALLYRKLLPLSFVKAVSLSLLTNMASIAGGIVMSFL